ncbi:MAG: F0F1 ATP synthase subunit epsilon [Elusimicrobia bacterium]|nr:F0F1 ATP synthase subunit epsilon [Elusimicrobiota bacterium]
MSKTLTLELVTPEKVALTASADFVVLPAFEGEMGVLPGHEAFLVQLKAGEVRVRSGADLKSFAVSGGFAEVNHDKVSIFAETAEMATEIDAERARQALERAKAEAQQAQGDALTLAQAEASLRRAQVRVRIAEVRGRRHPGANPPESDH